MKVVMLTQCHVSSPAELLLKFEIKIASTVVVRLLILEQILGFIGTRKRDQVAVTETVGT
jgi:hypothetical protein